MYENEVNAVASMARKKYLLLKKNKVGYAFSSLLAGIFVGFGVLLAFTVGGALIGSPYRSLAMGAVFGIALSLGIIAGTDLFTGNNFVMTMGIAKKTVTYLQTAKVWAFSFVGNLVGSVLVATMFVLAGLADESAGNIIPQISELKMTLPATELIFRGILCNILVCTAVWCSYRAKSESAKLIMVFWCLLAFVTTGFEHSIANMTLLTVGLLAPAGEFAVSLGGGAYNLLYVTLGNIIGGVAFVALPYIFINRKKLED